MPLIPLIQLMRLDKPIGTLLLWYPTAWALWMANAGMPVISVLLLFLAGTLLMRSAGCVINDYFDRDFDAQVARTCQRPLVTGQLKPKNALVLLGILLFLAGCILLYLPTACVYYACMAVLLTGLYPLGKRYIKTPQLLLSLAFSFGIPMSYAASNQPFTADVLFLMLINILWVVAYDTIYAMADKKDDLIAGIQSTAVYLGSYDKTGVFFLQMLMHLLWLGWAFYVSMQPLFFAFWFVAMLNLIWQQKLVQQQAFIQAFKSNNFYGLYMWMAIIIGLWR